MTGCLMVNSMAPIPPFIRKNIAVRKLATGSGGAQRLVFGVNRQLSGQGLAQGVLVLANTFCAWP